MGAGHALPSPTATAQPEIEGLVAQSARSGGMEAGKLALSRSGGCAGCVDGEKGPQVRASRCVPKGVRCPRNSPPSRDLRSGPATRARDTGRVMDSGADRGGKTGSGGVPPKHPSFMVRKYDQDALTLCPPPDSLSPARFHCLHDLVSGCPRKNGRFARIADDQTPRALRVLGAWPSGSGVG